MRDLKERLNLECVDFSHEIFARDKRGEGINFQSEGWDEMKKAITNAQKLVAHLNSGFHSDEDAREILSELVGYELDSSVWLLYYCQNF